MEDCLIALDADGDGAAQIIERVQLGATTADGGIEEAALQELLFRFPEALPISRIDPSYANAVPICLELPTRAGRIDALYANPAGRLTLVEFKLWRNPQARREVVGQILDYAKELASWRYEDLQGEVSKALGELAGNALYERVRTRDPDVNEADFVDNVTRCLKRGEFLLLVVGDGIREDIAKIVDFLRSHGGLRFKLALVEAAIYRDRGRVIVHPRILAKTETVRRVVWDRAAGRSPDEETEGAEENSREKEENLRFWKATLRDYAFGDTSIDVPEATDEQMFCLRVKNTGHGGWALWFGGKIDRTGRAISCFLSHRRNSSIETEIFEKLANDEEVRRELGDDLQDWKDGTVPRLGFQREFQPACLAPNGDQVDFNAAVSWMREHLVRLVDTLHPRIQRMIAHAKDPGPADIAPGK